MLSAASLNLWDEISIDRTVAWMTYANSGGVVGEIAASAAKRSGEIAPSAVLEQEDRTTWDGTMMGRIVEWMTGDIGKDFSKTARNRGKREKDVATLLTSIMQRDRLNHYSQSKKVEMHCG